MNDLYELIDCADALLKAHRFDEAVPVCEEVYVWITKDIRNAGLERDYLTLIPDEASLELYFGYSKHLGAYKIGISQNSEARARQIRSTNALYGRGDDFELLDYTSGPVDSVRAAERRIKQRYAHATVMGTEWISDRMDDAYDEYWAARDWLFEECLRTLKEFDPLAQLEREQALFQLLGRAPTAIDRLTTIRRKIRLWQAESDRMHKFFQQVQA